MPLKVPENDKTCNAPLDTLAQLGTDTEFPSVLKPLTDLQNLSVLQKRARSKYLTTAVALRLVDTNSPLVKQYWNTYHCCSALTVENQKVTGNYCKNRWCLVCNRIRTAELIKKYKEELFSWEDRHFVTLTVPNVPSKFLKKTIQVLNKEFTDISNTMKKRHQRMTGTRLICIKKIECTYNPDREDYHPHLHIITKDKVMAETLLLEWLKRHPECSSLAQDIRPASQNDLIELFKYFTKILSRSKKDKKITINASALDNIFQSIKGIRTFQPIGFKAPKLIPSIEEGDNQNDFAVTVDRSVVFDWIHEFHDWISADGEILSDFTPTEKLENIVMNVIK